MTEIGLGIAIGVVIACGVLILCLYEFYILVVKNPVTDLTKVIRDLADEVRTPYEK